MIQIIKRGTKKRITCPSCGALLSYEDEDIIKETSNEAYMSVLYKSYIRCAQCDEEIILEAAR